MQASPGPAAFRLSRARLALRLPLLRRPRVVEGALREEGAVVLRRAREAVAAAASQRRVLREAVGPSRRNASAHTSQRGRGTQRRGGWPVLRSGRHPRHRWGTC